MNNMDELDAIIDATESMAEQINQMLERMNDILPSCEMGKISNFECVEMAIGDVEISQPDGITLTVKLCDNCMKILYNHVNN